MSSLDQLTTLVFLVIALSIAGSFLWLQTIKERRLLIKRTTELKRKVLQAEILKELTNRIGYTFDVKEIIDILSGSLDQLLPYSTVSYLLVDEDEKKLISKIDIKQTVNQVFVDNVKEKMNASFSALRSDKALQFTKEDKTIGAIIDNENTEKMQSFFNIPLVVGDTVVGLLNVASTQPDLYGEKETELLYTITEMASTAVHNLSKVIKNEQHKTNAMITSLSSGLFMVDHEEKIVAINPAILTLLGITKSEGRVSLVEVIQAINSDVDIYNAIIQSITKGLDTKFDEIAIKNGFYQIIVSPVRDSEQKILGSVVLFYDLTAQKQLQRLREEFTAMMVHELKAPLTAMRWILEELQNETKLTKKKLVDPLNLMHGSTSKMLTLVKDLLDVSKIEAGKLELTIKEDKIAPLIRKKVKEFNPQAKQKGLKLSASIPKDFPNFEFDTIRIDQVLTNLISNAIKYTEKGSVKINSQVIQKKQIVRISIIDTGNGIDKLEQKKLFQKFVQLGDSSSQKKGTGLGLAVAKGIVESHNGKIGLDSELGKGTTFWFEIPIKQPASSKK